MKNRKKGFTLIELLVVVLIIGILAAIALPQYRKAVAKSEATEAMQILKSLYQAQQVYYMANGEFATKFADLEVDLPWTGTEAYDTNASVNPDTRSNGKWSLQIFKEKGYSTNIHLGRLNGAYKGTGFMMNLEGNSKGRITCQERKGRGVVFTGEAGDYCVKIFNGTKNYEDSWVRNYVLSL